MARRLEDLTFEIRADPQGVQRGMDQAERSVKEGSEGARRALESIGEGANRTLSAVRSMARGAISALGTIARTARNVALSFVAIGGAAAAAGVRASDQVTNMRNALIAAGNAADTVPGRIREIARAAAEARSGFAAVASLAARVQQNVEGVNFEDAVNFSRTINQALRIGGSTGAGGDAAVFQLIQGLSAGALRGEELNSILEQAPEIAKLLARELGSSVGQLRNLASQGLITSDVVLRAVANSADDVNERFGRLTPTFQEAWGVFQDGTRFALSDLGDIVKEATGITQRVQQAGELLTNLFAGDANPLQTFLDNVRTFDFRALGVQIAATLGSIDFGQLLANLSAIFLQAAERVRQALVSGIRVAFDVVRSIPWTDLLLGLIATLRTYFLQAIDTLRRINWSDVFSSMIDFLLSIDWVAILVNLAIAVQQVIVGLVTLVIDLVSEAVAGLLRSFSGPIDAVLGFFERGVEAIVNFFIRQVNRGIELLNRLEFDISPIEDIDLDFGSAERAATSLEEGGDDLARGIVGVTDRFHQFVRDLSGVEPPDVSLPEAQEGAFTGVFGAGFQAELDALQAQLRALFTSASEEGAVAVEATRKAAMESTREVTAGARGLGSAFAQSIVAATQDVRNAGEIIVQTLAETIGQQALTNLSEQLTDIFASVFDSLIGALSQRSDGAGSAISGFLSSFFGGGEAVVAHEGGILRGGFPGQEVPVVAEVGEAILSRNDLQQLLASRGDITIQQQVFGDQTAEQRRALLRNGQTLGRVLQDNDRRTRFR